MYYLKKEISVRLCGRKQRDGYIQSSIENSTKHRINILGAEGKGK